MLRFTTRVSAPLSDVTISVPSPAQGLICQAPAPFSLPVGASQTFQLCSESVSCPVGQTFNVNVTGYVDSDSAHCAVSDLTGSPIYVCSSCLGTVECSGTGGCLSNNVLSGTVVLDCYVGSTNLAGDVPALSGWTVSLYGSSGVVSNALASTTTDSKGNYSFTQIWANGTYTVVVTPSSWICRGLIRWALPTVSNKSSWCSLSGHLWSQFSDMPIPLRLNSRCLRAFMRVVIRRICPRTPTSPQLLQSLRSVAALPTLLSRIPIPIPVVPIRALI